MNDQNLEPEAENLLKAGKTNTEHLGYLPALYSIAISLKRIADDLDIAIDAQKMYSFPENKE